MAGSRHGRIWLRIAGLLGAAACAVLTANTAVGQEPADTLRQSDCTAGLRLPPGFCATIFADTIGSARHLVVAANGDVFVNVQAGAANSPNAARRPGVVALRDTDRDGVADVRERWADTGNTGIGLYGGYLYLDVGQAIVRYALPAGALRPSGPADTVIRGIPGRPGHRARNFAITREGTLFLNVGSASNACQARDRQRESPGQDPCAELEFRAGIWRFDANRTGQIFAPSLRYARGIRNATGLAINPRSGALHAATHGRDMLDDNWPRTFTREQNARLPAEELLQVNEGDDFGWPYCYWDGRQRKRVLAPEYGGEGNTVGRCDAPRGHLSALRAHWAPLALTFYDGTMFPERYRGAAFIAFHGSWNRWPNQEGYNVVFVPFTGSATTGAWYVFADGFGGRDPEPNTAPHRPAGIAVGPDGALYVSDDVGGTIWKIVYRGQ